MVRLFISISLVIPMKILKPRQQLHTKLRFSALNLYMSTLNLYVSSAYCEESQDYLGRDKSIVALPRTE